METTRNEIAGLPAAISHFFTYETTDPQAVAGCFADDGVVLDEGRERHGRAAIAAWNADAVARYRFTTELLSVQASGAQTTVTASVSGNFPGSPVHLRFRFTVAGDLIARLEISP